MSQTRREQRAQAAEARRAAREGGGPAPTRATTAPKGATTAPAAEPAPAGKVSRFAARVPRAPEHHAVKDRPPGIFGNFPVSEIAIACGALLVVLGLSRGPSGAGQTRLFVGLGLCAAGVFEFTVREHFAGYRAHTALLAGVPAAIMQGLTLLIAPSGSAALYVVLIPEVIVFVLAYQVLRGVYKRAAAERELKAAQSS